MSISVSDLTDQITAGSNGEFLYCEICGIRYSANSGDYFMLSDKDIFRCCDRDMVLAKSEVVIEIVKQ